MRIWNSGAGADGRSISDARDKSAPTAVWEYQYSIAGFAMDDGYECCKLLDIVGGNDL